MLSRINYKRLIVGMLAIAMFSCSNPWEEQKNNGDTNLNINLNEAISKTAELSQFGKLLAQTGYDKILAASKTYTVFAPTNDALAQVSTAILNDPETLKKFVANHIALTAFSSVRSQPQEKVKMLGDKYLIFKGTNLIDDATIIKADRYASNGVFHIIDKALTPKLNIWQYINSTAGTSKMNDYLLSLKDINIYDSDATAKANAFPGALADSLTNSYLKNVYNLNNEKNSYTLFLMQDAGYTTEVDKMKPYLTVATTDGTTALASYFTVRDMAFPKKYELNELPTSLTSRFGVEFPVDKTQIVGEPIRLSNGIVYIMKKVDVALTNRLLSNKVEGENNVGYLGTRTPILYRDRKDPAGNLFNDIMMSTTNTRAGFTLLYNIKDIMYSANYKVYWRAVNDVTNPGTGTNPFQQQLGIGGTILNIGTSTSSMANFTKLFPMTPIPYKNYDEILLGEFTNTTAGNIGFISLIGGTTAATSLLTLDYLKFVPVLK